MTRLLRTTTKSCQGNLLLLALLPLLLLLLQTTKSAVVVDAFTPTTARTSRPLLVLQAVNGKNNDNKQINKNVFNRRDLLTTITGGGLLMAFSRPKPAHATYSAFTRREQDWLDRSQTIEYSSARDLQSRLRDLVPANASGRDKIFCPNGPTANVSPLMENKCGDRLAIPSVYGRTQDVVGNSIPGFKGGAYNLNGNSNSLSTEVGGFPQYYNK